MTKDIVIQLFLDLKQFKDIKEAAESRKMAYKNNSDLIRKTLFDYTEKVANMVLTNAMIESKVGGLKEQSIQKESIIEALRAEIHNKNIEIERLENNLSLNILKAKK